MIMDLVGFVHVGTCQIKWKNSHIYIKSSISVFKVIEKTTQGQTQILFSKYFTVLDVFIHVYMAYYKYFQAYFMMLTIFLLWYTISFPTFLDHLMEFLLRCLCKLYNVLLWHMWECTGNISHVINTLLLINKSWN